MNPLWLVLIILLGASMLWGLVLRAKTYQGMVDKRKEEGDQE
ncbi:hypothetical protein SAMN05421734_105178 [Pelagirhabdus alkalitolerans]|uniref:Uncharacterized protein n=1 Tax=Pelagirhabdus alkalitolerans TaxID=1612202 RepID=A0A1G6JXE2_9BACI|nr:hypothetical protein [Pelagirhabdus alkalitolerans]SDC23449.1 hypothetical protein SAMN05421734_105178 [Pelagirhabdus alkalitolerans]